MRDSLTWSKYINEALFRYGTKAEVMFASHHWPRWGNERIQEVLRDQRDIYAHMNNEVLHHANQGVTINEIHNVYDSPASLDKGMDDRFLSRLPGEQYPWCRKLLPWSLGCQSRQH